MNDRDRERGPDGANGNRDPDSDVPSIAPAALQHRIDRVEAVRVLDLRNRDEVERWAITGPSVTLTRKPHNRFIQARVTDAVDSFVEEVAGDGPITVVCARGEASAAVAGHLDEAGENAHNLEGGMAAWARLCLTADFPPEPTPEGTTVVQYRRPASGCLGYAVLSDGEAAVVDPLRAFADRYVEDLQDRGATIRWVIDTHVHADHVSGLRTVADATDATPVVPEPARARGLTFDVETVTDGDECQVGDAVLEAVYAPGHTTGMTAFAVGPAATTPRGGNRTGEGRMVGDESVLLTGDSLFVGRLARPDLERNASRAGELARELHRTLTERFGRFPDATVVAPGHHGPDPDLAADGRHLAQLGELRNRPAFAMGVDEFADQITTNMPPRPANYETVGAVNLGRESVDDETAFELELGPNNCAATPSDR